MPRTLRTFEIDAQEREFLQTFPWSKVADQYRAGSRKGYRQLAPLPIMRAIYCMLGLEKMTGNEVSSKMGASKARIFHYFHVYRSVLEMPLEVRNMFDTQPPQRFHLAFDDALTLLQVPRERQPEVASRFFRERNKNYGVLRFLPKIRR